jgi:hypothetical protein
MASDWAAEWWSGPPHDPLLPAYLTLVMVLAAAVGAASLGGMAVRHPWAAMVQLALVTQAIGIVIVILSIFSRVDGGQPEALPLMLALGPIGDGGVLPYLVGGSIAWAILFVVLGRRLIDPAAIEAERAVPAHDGRTLGITIGLTVAWYATALFLLSNMQWGE